MAQQKEQKKKYIKTGNTITIDKLALMTQQGFIEQEAKFNKSLKELSIEFDKSLNDLNNKVNKSIKELDNKIDKSIKELDKKIDDKFNKVMIGQDKLIEMLEFQRKEDLVHDGLHQDVGDTLANHEIRIHKVEEKVF